jgi:type VI protein secretion system component VasF
MMLAYTNRFLALASLIRKLYAAYQASEKDRPHLREQIQSLRRRLGLVRQMQASGMLSFCCVYCACCFSIWNTTHGLFRSLP